MGMLADFDTLSATNAQRKEDKSAFNSGIVRNFNICGLQVTHMGFLTKNIHPFMFFSFKINIMDR